MKRISLFIFLSSLLAFSGCREDIDDTEVIPSALDFNLVTIDNVSEPGEDGFRTITLTLSDKTGSSLKMTAGSCYKHLEAGWYSIVTNADERLEAQTELIVNGSEVNVDSGSILVRKKDYEYLIRFEMETDKGRITALADGKKLYFESEKYSSFSTGANGIFLKDQIIRSEILNSTMKYSIYLPEGYDGSRKYPILYILHGMNGNNNDWLQDNTGGLWDGGGTMPAYAREYAEVAGKDLIIVSPEGKNLFYCNGYEHGMNYMSYFFEEFVPFIESEYAVKAERSSRAIGGLSMGGYGSLYYGLLHPEMFCHVYACSAVVSVGGAAPDPMQFLSEASSSGRIKDLPGFTIEIGTEDSLFANNEAFVRTLDGYNVPYEYITRSGGHDWKFWNACSPKIIRKVLTVFE